MTHIRQWIGLVDDLARWHTDYIGYQLLTEAGRIDFLLKTYGAKLAAKYTSEQQQLPVAVSGAVQQEPGQDIGQKVLSYLVSFDPTSNHEYAQWLTIRYLKGALKLEDGPRAYDYLEVFHRAKKVRSQQVAHRITDTNIMNYADLDALYHVIAPFMTDVSRAPTTDDDRLVRRMSQEDQATIAYDGEDMMVVIPHTIEAAKYWGRNTVWCTTWEPPRTNYFDYYNRLGPLYIAILKPGGEKYQFSFDWQSGSVHGQFMDKNDREINMPAFIKQHPAMIKIVGEQKLLPWADQIGLDMFSPKIKDMLGAQRMGQIVGRRILSQFDAPATFLADVPAEMLPSFAFQQALLSRAPKALAYLPEDVYRPNIVELLRQCDNLFQFVPDDLKTPETAEAAVTRMQDYRQIDSIPENLWSPTTASRYYLLRAAQDRGLRLGDVPETYRSQKVIVDTLAHNPDDIPQFESLLNGRIAREIVSTYWEAGWKLPAQYFDEHMAKTLTEYRNPAALRLFTRMPHQYWTKAAAETVAENPLSKFAQIPEQFHTVGIIGRFLHANPARVNQVPADLLTGKAVRDLHTPYFRALLKHAEPGHVTDEAIIDWLRGVHNRTSRAEFVSDLPERYFTRPIVANLIEGGDLPIDHIPVDLMNDDTLYRRLDVAIDELPTVPPEKFTEPLAVRVAKRFPGWVAQFPDHVLTRPVLHAMVQEIVDRDTRSQRAHAHNYRPYDARTPKESMDQSLIDNLRSSFGRFPPNAWDGDDLSKMLQLKLFEPDLSKIPETAVNHSVIEQLAVDAPDQLKAVRATRRMEQEVVTAVRRQPMVLLTINPKLLTEPVSYAALNRWGEAYYHNGMLSQGNYLYHATDGSKLRRGVDRLPKKVWSQRCWNAAVTYVVPYDKVPEPFRVDELTKVALLRKPDTIKAIPNPLAFLNANIKQRDAKAGWLRDMEKLGFIRQGRGWISTHGDLQKTPVEGFPEFSVSVSQAGSNKRIYLYKGDEQILALHTKDGKVRLQNAYKYNEYRPVLVQVARDYLSDYDLGDLDDLKIYKVNGVIGGGEEQVPRERYKWTTRTHVKHPTDPYRYSYKDEEHVGQVDWTDVPRRNGHIYTAYVGNDKLLQVTTEKKGWKQDSKYDGTQIFDYQKALPHIEEIWHFLQSHRVEFFWNLTDIGMTTKSKGWSGPDVSILAKRKVGEVGDLTVWTNGSKVGLYGPKGLVGTGWLTTKGKITKVQPSYKYEKMGDKITAVLAKAAEYIHRKEGDNFAMAADITPDKKEAA